MHYVIVGGGSSGWMAAAAPLAEKIAVALTAALLKSSVADMSETATVVPSRQGFDSYLNAGRNTALRVVIDIRVVGSFGPGKSSV